MTSAEQQIKSAKEDLVIENAEVTMYDTLLQVAQLMNAGDAVPVLNQNLAEERAIVLPEGEEGREVVVEGAVTAAATEDEEERRVGTSAA
jgi:hypothetical protein